jgi:hypothetical protein
MSDIETLVISVEAFSAATARAERRRLLARIRSQLGNLRAADEKARAELEAIFKSASEGGVVAAEALQAALSSRVNERSVAEALLPRIQSLQRYLTDTPPLEDPEAHRLLEKAVNIALGYAAGYQNLRDRLIADAAGLETAAGGVSHRRPAEGEIDHAALTREIIARFPKILAALAE